MRLPDSETAVEVEADPGQRFAPTEHFSTAGPLAHRRVAEALARRQRRRLRRFARIRPVALEADVGERRWR